MFLHQMMSRTEIRHHSFKELEKQVINNLVSDEHCRQRGMLHYGPKVNPVGSSTGGGTCKILT